MDIKTFNLNSFLIEYLDSKKITKYFPVQRKVIPLLLKDKQVFVEAPTGTGKTLSYLLPILTKINFSINAPQTIIFVPTRELAMQLSNVLKEIKHFLPELRLKTLTGGFDIKKQVKKNALNPHLIIATPDRLNKYFSLSPFPTKHIKYIILDEVDMLINFGFTPLIEDFLKNIKQKILFALFSATFSSNERNFIKKIIKNEITNITIEKEIKKEKIFIIKTYEEKKLETLLKLINSDKFNPFFCIVFAKSNKEVKRIYSFLKNEKLKKIDFFSSELPQRERNSVIKKINNMDLLFLVTTDLIARGMDFNGVSHIVNYDLPSDLSYFKHRIGRTNRNNVYGQVYNIYCSKDSKKYDVIEKKNKSLEFVKINI